MTTTREEKIVQPGIYERAEEAYAAAAAIRARGEKK